MLSRYEMLPRDNAPPLASTQPDRHLAILHTLSRSQYLYLIASPELTVVARRTDQKSQSNRDRPSPKAKLHLRSDLETD